jgi:hypothetical protein
MKRKKIDTHLNDAAQQKKTGNTVEVLPVLGGDCEETLETALF